MRSLSVLLGVFVLCSIASAQKLPAELPTQFEIGVHTFFDFGPPNDFLQLYMVRGAGVGSQLERIILTPEGIKCLAPPKIEIANAKLDESIAELLGKKNPCSIPEKELNRERKRCKKCSVYSGANVTMQVQCGDAVRLIRSDILDRDMFDAAVRTPENTAWTMFLLGKLDKAAGPGVLEKPIFAVDIEPSTDRAADESEVMKEIANGNFDGLFPSAPDKVSHLYREARSAKPARPTVTLLEVLSTAPTSLVDPQYPPLAKMTRTEGTVKIGFEIDPSGVPKDMNIIAGHPLLQQAAKDAVSKWKFPASNAGEKLQATFEFALNCPK